MISIKKKKRIANKRIELIKACGVYPKEYSRVRSFWIYITVSFFKTFSPLSLCVCVLKYLVFSKKNFELKLI